jgi:hypothetical protein
VGRTEAADVAGAVDDGRAQDAQVEAARARREANNVGVSKRTNELMQGCIAMEDVPSHALQLLLGFETELSNAGPGLHRGVLLAGFLKWAKEEEVRH